MSFNIFWIKANGNVPNHKDHPYIAMWKTVTVGVEPLFKPSKWSSSFKDFLSYCLSTEAEKRMDCQTILKHPFLKQASDEEKMKKVFENIFFSNTLNQNLHY